jgi:hypothetical protein
MDGERGKGKKGEKEIWNVCGKNKTSQRLDAPNMNQQKEDEKEK